jgi:hypothetical protein
MAKIGFEISLVIASGHHISDPPGSRDIGRPSPKIAATISESVSLPRSLLELVLRRYTA